MKKFKCMLQNKYGRFPLGICLVGILTMLATENPAVAQQGKFITQASARLTKLIDLSNADGYKLQNNSFSVGGGWLKQGDNNWVGLFSVELIEGRSYRFLGAGDNDARDVDLQIVDPKNVGKVFAADEGTEADAIVNFQPKLSGRYLVRMRLYASQNNVPCVCLGIVMTK